VVHHTNKSKTASIYLMVLGNKTTSPLEVGYCDTPKASKPSGIFIILINRAPSFDPGVRRKNLSILSFSLINANVTPTVSRGSKAKTINPSLVSMVSMEISSPASCLNFFKIKKN